MIAFRTMLILYVIAHIETERERGNTDSIKKLVELALAAWDSDAR